MRYHEENPGVFSCSDTAWVLAFGLMMLNTDMYNRNIKVRGGGVFVNCGATHRDGELLKSKSPHAHFRIVSLAICSPRRPTCGTFRLVFGRAGPLPTRRSPSLLIGRDVRQIVANSDFDIRRVRTTFRTNRTSGTRTTAAPGVSGLRGPLKPLYFAAPCIRSLKRGPFILSAWRSPTNRRVTR